MFPCICVITIRLIFLPCLLLGYCSGQLSCNEMFNCINNCQQITVNTFNAFCSAQVTTGIRDHYIPVHKVDYVVNPVDLGPKNINCIRQIGPKFCERGSQVCVERKN